jgi:hypothetical protein
VPAGKHRGIHVGRVAVRASGSFNLRTATGLRQGIGWRHLRLVQRADGYGYALTVRAREPRPHRGRRSLLPVLNDGASEIAPFDTHERSW